MSRLARAAVFGATALVACLGARSATAFCRTTTIQKPASFSEVLQQQCFTDGKPLWWAGRCVGYSLNATGTKKLAFGDVETALKNAVATWSSVTCPTGSGSGQVSIDLRYLGPAACDKVEFRGDAGNVNLVVFRDDSWPADQDPEHVIALTTVQYNTTSGELRGWDMEINTANQNITLDGAGNTIALSGVLTHETGHVLGFAHSTDKTATMYEKYNSTIGTLKQDDIDAICTVYPPDGTRPSADGTRTALACDPTPPRGYVPDCPADSGGCSCTTAGRSDSSLLAIGAVGVVALVVARGARRRRRG